MDRWMPSETRSRRWLLATLLLALSAGLHAMLLGGLAGRMLHRPDGTPLLEPQVIEVSLLTPPKSAEAAPDAHSLRSQDVPAPVRAAARRPVPAPVPTGQTGAVERSLPSIQPLGLADDPSTVETGRSEPDQADPSALMQQAANGAADPPEVAGSPSVLDTSQQTTSSQEVAPPVPPQPMASLSPSLAGDPSAFPAMPPLPSSHARRFKVYWGDFEGKQSVASIRYRLTVDREQYEVRTEGEAEGLISLVYSGTLTQISSGTMGPSGLVPLRYAESRGRSAVRSVGFHPEASQLLPPGAAPIAVPRGIQDRLSVFYQLGLMARADPAAFAPGREVVVPVASLRDMRLERFRVVGDEVLMVPGSPMRALHLHRPPPAGSRDPKIDLWLGYDQQMLPVRLRVEDSSQRVLDQLVDSAE